MGSSKPKAPPPSAEYQQYVDKYKATTPKASPVVSAPVASVLNKSGFKDLYNKTPTPSSTATPSSVPQSAPSPQSEPMLTEQQYYEDKYAKQQKAYQAKLDAQIKAQNDEFAKLQKEQQTILTKEQEAQAAKIAEIKRTDSVTRRDSMLADRAKAEESARGYVSQQVARERSNAALFGIEYDVTPDVVATREQKYLSSIWGTESDTAINKLFEEVGKPEGFQDFGMALPTEPPSTPESVSPTNTVVSTSKGTKRANRNTLLTANQELGGLNTVLGG